MDLANVGRWRKQARSRLPARRDGSNSAKMSEPLARRLGYKRRTLGRRQLYETLVSFRPIAHFGGV